MATLSNATGGGWRAYVIPAAVCQSLMIGGGYGTGREIVEYFSKYGMRPGLLGLALVGVCFSVLLAVSYELARVYRAYDYRSFFRELLGRGWIAFEVLYISMSALVVAVICAAAGSLVEKYLHLPAFIGIGILLAIVILFSFKGRDWVTGILAWKAAVLCTVIVIYFLLIGQRDHAVILQQLGMADSGGLDFVGAALRYAMYCSVVIPATLFTTRVITTRKQAVVSGIISGIAAVLPGILMHLSFASGYPTVFSADLPTYVMITGLGLGWLTWAYVLVLFGSLFDVGLGFIQSVNERLDTWFIERRGQPLSPGGRAAVALACLVASGCLSLVGIVPLIAKGYGSMAWGFLILYIAPLLTIGIVRLKRREPLPPVSAQADVSA